MSLIVRRITQTSTVMSADDIDKAVNDKLRELSYLHEMRVENISYDKSTDPMFKNAATIRYSYTGVIDELYNHINEFCKEYEIPITPDSIVVVKDPILGNLREERLPLKVAILERGYIPKKGDIIIL